MKKFKVPMTWKMYGVFETEANSLEEAKEKALAWDTDLPKGRFVIDSIVFDEEIIDEMNQEHLTLQNE